MLKNLFLVAICSMLWTACSAPAPEQQPAEKKIIESNSRSSEDKDELIGRESDLVFARKWKNKEATFVMDFRLDGSFSGELDGQSLNGKWSISEDQKTLQLKKAEEAEGDDFNKAYSIISSSPEKVKLMDDAGVEWLLTSVE